MTVPSDPPAPGRPRSRSRILLLAVAAVLALVAGACDPAPPPAPASPDPVRAITFKGLGVWWDVYDWSPTFTKNRQKLGVADVERLARNGVQTLYIQTATFRHPDVILDPWVLRAILDRAHAHGIRVVGWYLPEFTDPAYDLDRLVAIGRFGFDGIGIDIESTANGDVAARSRNLIVESTFIRGMFPNLPMAAIPVTPVIWEELNRGWWPNFPYQELVPLYDAWMPMAYWSYRFCSFTDWYDAYRYTYESVARLKALTRRPDLAVHPIGGEATPDVCKSGPRAGQTPPATTAADLNRMNAAMIDSGAIGGSIYDDNTTPSWLYDSLQQFRRDLVK
ncbi:MAG: hypothetical protein ACYC2O_03860 [Microthrixaceae bacterium]